jgi:large subunit ribosomal protein L18
MNDLNKLKRQKRILRHNRVRSVVEGTPKRPRLSVFRSSTHMYAQLIDDQSGKTLASASTLEVKDKTAKTGKSAAVGKLLADKAKALKIDSVVFDRGGYRYHGRVKALADAAREGGLKF